MSPVEEILMLPVDERLKVVETIWDSITTESNEVILTESQREELDSRRKAYEEGRMKFLSWEEVKTNIRSRRK